MEKSLLSLVRQLEAGALKLTPSVYASTKSLRDERIPEYEASGSCHNQIGIEGDDPSRLINLHDKEGLPGNWSYPSSSAMIQRVSYSAWSDTLRSIGSCRRRSFVQPLCAWREKPSLGITMKMGGGDFGDGRIFAK